MPRNWSGRPRTKTDKTIAPTVTASREPDAMWWLGDGHLGKERFVRYGVINPARIG